MQSWRAVAAANNADWCDAVCRSHGRRSVRDAEAWSCPARTPPLYPDAITLDPHARAAAVLARVDASAGCSVKDSFAALELDAHGFSVLFEAEWIVRRPHGRDDLAAVPPGWGPIAGHGEFGAWEEAWRRSSGAPAGLLGAGLAAEPVAFLGARHDGRIVAGAIASPGSGVVGIGNVFTVTGEPSATWAGCIATAARLWPGAALVGYESGGALEAARAQGFVPAGPLRVWHAP